MNCFMVFLEYTVFNQDLYNLSSALKEVMITKDQLLPVCVGMSVIQGCLLEIQLAVSVLFM